MAGSGAAHNDVGHASLVSGHTLLVQHIAGAAAGRGQGANGAGAEAGAGAYAHQRGLLNLSNIPRCREHAGSYTEQEQHAGRKRSRALVCRRQRGGGRRQS